MTEANPDTIGFWPFLMMIGPVTIGGLLVAGQMTGAIHYKEGESAGQVDAVSYSKAVNRVVAVLRSRDKRVSGRIVFDAISKHTGTTRVTGEVRGLKKGKYAFRVNEYGDLSDGVKGTGKLDRDLGEIEVDYRGIATIDFIDETRVLALESLLGRSVVIGTSDAFGVIGLSNALPPSNVPVYKQKKKAKVYKVKQDAAPVKVVITGAAGQIGYSILPLIATGQVFGPNQKVILSLLEITPVLPALKGVRMELDDCAYPLLDDIICTDNADVAFKDADYAVLVGGFPRRKGMLRKDLLAKNAPIFRAMGRALEKNAKRTCKVVVVANPANTNCLIAATNAPSIPKKNFCALTRLDFNRARNQFAQESCVKPEDVKNTVIWGNHSKTQVPDVTNASVKGKPISMASYHYYLTDEFIPLVQNRGKAIIDARGKSSALSAANAAKDCLRDWVQGTPGGQTVAMAVYSNGEYGIAKGIFYSFPVITRNGEYKVVEDYKVTDDIRKLMKASEAELLEEKKEAGL